MITVNERSNFFDRLIDVPTSDPDDRRRRRLLNILLSGMGILSAVTIIIVIVWAAFNEVKDAGDLWLGLISALGMLCGTLIFYFINRNQRIPGWIASSSFLVFLMAIFAFTDSSKELANGRSLFIFIIPVIIASILLKPSSSFVFALLSSIEIGYLASISQTPINTFAMAGFFLVAFIAWLSSRNLEQALRELRQINVNLDKLVEQKTHELAISLSREQELSGRNQAILDSIADGVIVFDANKTSILANPALSQLTEKPLPNLVDIAIDNFLETENLSPSNRSIIKDLIDNPTTTTTTTTRARVIWGNKTLSTSIARVQDAKEKNIGTVAVFRDITREAELEQMKNTFIAIVSHELRTPLNAILGYAEMFKEGIYGQVNEKQQNISSRIMSNSQRLLNIVSDLLDQAQIEAGRLKIQMNACKPVELLDNLQGVMEKLASDKGIGFSTELDPSMPPVILGDSHRLQQIMINLSNNAVKFTEKGSVRVKVSRVDERNWQIQAIDTGSGIPQESLEYIFESFRQVEVASTRQHGGVGLGLSIVKQLVELMKGKINAESQVGKGSVFTVTLPLVAYQNAESTTTKTQE